MTGGKTSSTAKRIVLASLALVLFFSHVFPFALFGLGFAAIFPWKRPNDWIRAALPTVPALAALGWWYFFTPVGEDRAGGGEREGRAQHGRQFRRAARPGLHQHLEWSTNIFRDTSDEAWFAAFVFVVLLS